MRFAALNIFELMIVLHSVVASGLVDRRTVVHSGDIAFINLVCVCVGISDLYGGEGSLFSVLWPYNHSSATHPHHYVHCLFLVK